MSHDEQQARWNQRFSGEDYLFGTAPNAFLASQRALLHPGQTALAVADGEARNGVFLAEQGLDVLSIDFSANGLAKARRLAAARGVALRTEQVDLFAWDWHGRSFDIIAAIFIQFATPAQRTALFADIKQSLAPGGISSCKAIGRSSSTMAPAARPTPRTCIPRICCAPRSVISRSSICASMMTPSSKAPAMSACRR
jgi:cyclopropane fatty-acyl-phospholipid synthase-like methyltransferase